MDVEERNLVKVMKKTFLQMLKYMSNVYLLIIYGYKINLIQFLILQL